MTSSFLIALVVLLVSASAFFSSSEIVYAQALRPRLKNEAERGDRRAVLALGITDDYVRAISTILVGNDLVNIAAASVVTLLSTEIWFAENANADLLAELIATGILLVFGEIFPKLLAADHANRLALVFSRPLSFAMKLFKPVVKLVSAAVGKASPLWTPENSEPSYTDEELAMVVDSIQEEGVITEAAGELIKSAIEFRDVAAYEILRPRVEIRAWNIEDPPEEVLSDPEALIYSRIPVYREDIDHIIGILPVKQLAKALLTGEKPTRESIEAMLLPAGFVHMTKSIKDILTEMRENQSHMVFVVDEYGGLMGLLTMEDILEEIVGDIYDETDEVEPEDVVEVKEDTFLLDGSTNIYDAFDEMEYAPHDFATEYTTLSGWITEQLDRFPKEGDSFRFDMLTVTVLAVDGVLVEQARIHIEREEDE